MRKEGHENIYGIVVQVVSMSDGNNQYDYAWVWAVWEDTKKGDKPTAPGNNKSQLHAMRKNYENLKKAGTLPRKEPDIPRSIFIDHWCAALPHRRSTTARYLELAARSIAIRPGLRCREPPGASRSVLDHSGARADEPSS